VKIKRLKNNNLKLFFRYLNTNFKKKHILTRSKKIFDWQYLSGKKYNFYYLLKKNKIKSVQGFIPTNHFDKKIKKNGIFLSVWSSSEITSGAKLLFYILSKIKYYLVIGLGSSKDSYKFQKLLGYKCGYLDHFFLTSDKFKKKLIYPQNFSNYKKIEKKVNYKKLKSEKDILELSKEIFNYQEPQKTPRYLINRYFRNPFYKYIMYAVESKKKISAVFVFRICSYNDSSAVRIVDFIGSNYMFSRGKYLFDFILKETSADYIDIYCYGVPKSYLKASNLENIKKYYNKNLIIPNYYEPFIKRNINLTFAYKVNKKIVKNIRFFKGDSDLDRPNMI